MSDTNTPPDVPDKSKKEKPNYGNLIYLKAEDDTRSTVRLINAALLSQHATAFENMFAVSKSDEGESESNPIVLPVTPDELDNFLDWNFRSWDKQALRNDPEQYKAKCLMLLKVCRLWDHRVGAEEAIETLNSLQINPCERLEMGRQYMVPDWGDEAVTNLIERKSLKDIAQTERNQLGLDIYEIIAIAREVMMDYRIHTAFEAIGLDFDGDSEYKGCSVHDRCVVVWKQFWWRHVARQLLHPAFPMTLRTTASLAFYVEAATIEGLERGCHEAVVRKLLGWDHTSRILDHTIARVKAVMGA